MTKAYLTEFVEHTIGQMIAKLSVNFDHEIRDPLAQNI